MSQNLFRLPTYITPGYRDFFTDEPIFGELVSGIPTKIIIAQCAIINATLFSDPLNQEKQILLLKFLTRRFPQNIKTDILQRLAILQKRSPEKPVLLFSGLHAIEFIHRSLLHFCDKEIEDTTVDQEIRLFKAYLIMAHELSYQSVFKPENQTATRQSWRSIIWPIFYTQLEINHAPSSHFQMLKLTAFLKYLNQHSVYSTYLKRFLENIGNTTLAEFLIYNIGLIANILSTKTENNAKLAYPFVKVDNKLPLLASLTLSMLEYAEDARLHKNYKGFKEKPFIEYETNVFLPISFGFALSRLFVGFIFDFYKTSGIKNLKGHSSFDNFKSQYSKEFMEKKLFRGIMNLIFQYKQTVKVFEEMDNSPDCYVRLDNIILLIEFKDYFVADDIIVATDYEAIKQDIDRKFISNEQNKAKGIRQLANHISFLNKNSYAFDDFTNKGRKRSNIVIYPIIVHTNHLYTVSDINDYLNDEFKMLLTQCEMRVKNIVLIELETLFRFIGHYRSKKYALTDSLDRYYKIKKSRVENFEKSPNYESFEKAYTSYEDLIPTLAIPESNLQDEKLLSLIFHAMGISREEGLF